MRISAGLLVVALSMFVTAAHSSQFVVLQARGIGLRPGTILGPGRPLRLRQGQHVTLISDTGVTQNFDGPYEREPYIEGGRRASFGSTLGGLVRERGRRYEMTATRGGGQSVILPNPWLLDASHGGNVCLLEGQAPVFWRPDPASAVHFGIMPSDRSWKAEATWPQGVDRLAISTPVVMHGDTAYLITYNGTELAFVISAIPASLVNDRMRAAWMAEKGCEVQAEALLRMVQ